LVKYTFDENTLRALCESDVSISYFFGWQFVSSNSLHATSTVVWSPAAVR
jgi:hypothetical protein